MTDIRVELDHLAKLATAQGKAKLAAVFLLAVAKIEELESVLDSVHAGQRLGGQKGSETRNARLSPERRREIATTAAKQRWGRRRAS